MRRHLIRFLRWCLARLEPSLELSLIQRATELMNLADTTTAKGTSSEWKRHVVYARLGKEYRQLPKRYIALAIERAMMERPR